MVVDLVVLLHHKFLHCLLNTVLLITRMVQAQFKRGIVMTVAAESREAYKIAL
jgi:hypothetical protein